MHDHASLHGQAKDGTITMVSFSFGGHPKLIIFILLQENEEVESGLAANAMARLPAALARLLDKRFLV